MRPGARRRAARARRARRPPPRRERARVRRRRADDHGHEQAPTASTPDVGEPLELLALRAASAAEADDDARRRRGRRPAPRGQRCRGTPRPRTGRPDAERVVDPGALPQLDRAGGQRGAGDAEHESGHAQPQDRAPPRRRQVAVAGTGAAGRSAPARTRRSSSSVVTHATARIGGIALVLDVALRGLARRERRSRCRAASSPTALPGRRSAISVPTPAKAANPSAAEPDRRSRPGRSSAPPRAAASAT